MVPAASLILSLAYILGLLGTAWSQQIIGLPSGGVVLLLLGLGAAWVVPRYWRAGPRRLIWMSAGVIGLLASLYYQVQVPHPADNDISRYIPTMMTAEPTPIVAVQGQIISTPRLTRSQRVQFWLEAGELAASTHSENDSTVEVQSVSGKLYVTVPILWGTGLHPGQGVTVKGILYEPRPATNPGGFDFRAYLTRQGGFAGLRAQQVDVLKSERTLGRAWWAVRQRIIRAQVLALGSPAGPLLSSMVLGGRVVDLPHDIRDRFTQVGLAHTIAASGFHTTLVLGMVLTLTRNLKAQRQLGFGIGALGLYSGLTGFQPSVLRASLMGAGALSAAALRRKVRPLGSLLLVAVLLLVLNPLWIWNLGFQLSFLATLGLLVTVPSLTRWLDWLPPAIATVLAVPLAAYLWTLPVLLHAFGLVSPYTIPLNVLVTPLVALISLGGMTSALAALLWPPVGSAVAWLLSLPIQLLLTLVVWFSNLPGAAVATGTISVPQLLGLYSLIGLVWLWPRWRRRWWLAGLIAVVMVVIPGWYARATQFQVTVLAASENPVMVVQARGQIGLINSGDRSTAQLTVLPFLQQQGVNRLDWAIATSFGWSQQEGWGQILDQMPIGTFYTATIPDPANRAQMAWRGQASVENYQRLSSGITVALGSIQVQRLAENLPAWQIQVQNQDWLLLEKLESDQQRQLIQVGQRANLEVLWWSGSDLTPALLPALNPKVAIASAGAINPEILAAMQQHQIQLYWTGQDGAVQWAPETGFRQVLSSSDEDASTL